jgi:hypothetical protein
MNVYLPAVLHFIISLHLLTMLHEVYQKCIKKSKFHVVRHFHGLYLNSPEYFTLQKVLSLIPLHSFGTILWGQSLLHYAPQHIKFLFQIFVYLLMSMYVAMFRMKIIFVHRHTTTTGQQIGNEINGSKLLHFFVSTNFNIVESSFF